MMESMDAPRAADVCNYPADCEEVPPPGYHVSVMLSVNRLGAVPHVKGVCRRAPRWAGDVDSPRWERNELTLRTGIATGGD